MKATDTLVIALPGGMRLATALARSLRCEATELAVHHFPDGEQVVRIDAAVDGRFVVLAGSLQNPDNKTLALVFAADAARELGASSVGLVAPYLAYMRQDKRFKPGEAITSRSYARLLSAAVDFLITVDPHLHRWHDLSEIYSIPTQVVAAAPAIARWIHKHVPNALLVGPDEESEQWVREVARLTECPFTVMAKTRRGDHDVRVRLAARGPWPGRQAVLLDDIISTGQTLIAAAGVLRQAGIAPAVCIGVHALLAADAQHDLLAAGVGRVVTCDTIAHDTNGIGLAPLLARAVRAML